MNTTFKIPHIKTDAISNLIVEIGTSNIAIFCYSTYPFTATGFYYYTITENDNTALANALQSIFTEEHLSTAGFENVHIFYNNADTTLVPTSYFKKEALHNNIAALMFGNKTNYTNLHETTSIKSIENIYAVPLEIKTLMDNIFPNAISMHSISMALQSTNGTKLFATVYEKEIKLVLYKENEFTLAAYFDYATPEDVCYHMLNACERFAVSPSEIELIINGMIDTNSNLYKEMYKFFVLIQIENLPDKVQLANGFEDIASHYYLPLVKLAKCVS